MEGAINSLLLKHYHFNICAEGEGFEPPRPIRACRFSRPVHSTALPSLQSVNKIMLLPVPEHPR